MVINRGRAGHYRMGPRPIAMSAPQPLVQVRFFTAHGVTTGKLRLSFNRLSDQLNFGPPLLELEQAELTRLDHARVHRATRLAYVQKDEILLAIDRTAAGYGASDPSLREAKKTVAITIDLGHFVVQGTLHSHYPDLAGWLLAGQLFVPLTDVIIYGDGAGPVREPVAIVNRVGVSIVLD